LQGGMPADLTLKTAFLRGPLVRVAAMASVSGLTGLGDAGFVFLGRGGAVADFCFRTDCASSITVASNLTFAGAILFMWNGAGMIARVSPRLALLAEIDTMIPLGRVLGLGRAAHSGAFMVLRRRPWLQPEGRGAVARLAARGSELQARSLAPSASVLADPGAGVAEQAEPG